VSVYLGCSVCSFFCFWVLFWKSCEKSFACKLLFLPSTISSFNVQDLALSVLLPSVRVDLMQSRANFFCSNRSIVTGAFVCVVSYVACSSISALSSAQTPMLIHFCLSYGSVWLCSSLLSSTSKETESSLLGGDEQTDLFV